MADSRTARTDCGSDVRKQQSRTGGGFLSGAAASPSELGSDTMASNPSRGSETDRVPGTIDGLRLFLSSVSLNVKKQLVLGSVFNGGSMVFTP